MKVRFVSAIIVRPCVTAVCGFSCPPALPRRARSAPPAYQELRFEEDWSYLASTPSCDLWDPLKYVELGREGWYTSVGAEARVRFEFFRNAAFGAAPETPNGFLIQRYLLHADTHLGRHLRFFTQAQSGLENWRVGGTARHRQGHA